MMGISDVIELIELLEAAGVWLCVDGGWGVDAVVGEQTRPHDDLDLTIDIEHVELATTALVTHGFSLCKDEYPCSFVMRDADDRRVDIHPVRLDDTGAWQAQPNAPDFHYPPGSLQGSGTIGGRLVRCVAAEFQPYAHLGYEPDEGDFKDMFLLRDRLGIQLPWPYNR